MRWLAAFYRSARGIYRRRPRHSPPRAAVPRLPPLPPSPGTGATLNMSESSPVRKAKRARQHNKVTLRFLPKKKEAKNTNKQARKGHVPLHTHKLSHPGGGGRRCRGHFHRAPLPPPSPQYGGHCRAQLVQRVCAKQAPRAPPRCAYSERTVAIGSGTR